LIKKYQKNQGKRIAHTQATRTSPFAIAPAPLLNDLTSKFTKAPSEVLRKNQASSKAKSCVTDALCLSRSALKHQA
jgi:hypothetical protein